MAKSLDIDDRRFETAILTDTSMTSVMDTIGGVLTYIGRAPAGSSKAAAVWQIKKLVYSGSDLTDIQFASGTATFTKVWNSRASYSYS